MSNNIYEFGGVADILIRMKTARTIGGVNYAANEPYTLLKDVNIQFIYEQNAKQSSAKSTVYAFNSGRPSQILVNNIPLSQKIANLILTNDLTKTYSRTRKEMVYCKDGVLTLNYNPLPEDIFVFDSDMNKVDCTLFDNNKLCADKNLINDMQYLVFYYESVSGDKYSFEMPSYGYFIADIFIKGNTNKITNDVYIHFDALSLASVPNFNIMSGGILNTPLVFNIIYTNQDEPIIVFEE